MKITRRSSYIIALVIVICFFGLGGLFIGIQEQEQSDTEQYVATQSSAAIEATSTEIPNPTESSENDLSKDALVEQLATTTNETGDGEGPDEGFALKDFHRSETKDGRLLWEIVGKNARYYPTEKRVDIQNCIFSTTDEKGKQMVLRAGKAKLFLSGPTLDSAHFSADVTLDYDKEVKVLTPEATYQHKDGFVTTSAHVRVISEWYMIEGDGLKAYLDKEQYEILENVSSVIEPGKKKREKKKA